jgi:putative spermidine/putrescine transport system ATP-binding protein
VTETAAATAATARAGVEVRLENLRRTYGTVTALDGLDLTLHPGELVALLGPSGCGKTTALRLLAGLEDADDGHITVAGQDVTRVPANKRDMGMVFQAYSLFPNMTARQNVAFGLRLRGVGDAERRRRAGEMLDLVGLAAQADRYAHQLSGGQQQRVALARALAIRPKVLLLDEPLSALDAKVRAQLRDEIRRVQLEVGITTLFVTHDQEEALAIADRVGVMQAGRLAQLGTPTEVYHRPATPFVAEFVGLTNKLPARVHRGVAAVLGVELPLVDPSTADGPATALVRPEAITLAAHADDGATGPLVGQVIATSFLGAVSRITVDLGEAGTVLAQLPTAEAAHYAAGSRARLSLRRDAVLVTPGLPATPGSAAVAGGSAAAGSAAAGATAAGSAAARSAAAVGEE